MFTVLYITAKNLCPVFVPCGGLSAGSSKNHMAGWYTFIKSKCGTGPGFFTQLLFLNWSLSGNGYKTNFYEPFLYLTQFCYEGQCKTSLAPAYPCRPACRRCLRGRRWWCSCTGLSPPAPPSPRSPLSAAPAARVSDPHWFNADPDTDPDPAFFLIADPDPGFDDLKSKKIYRWKFHLYFLDHKLQFTYP